ncbi:hypothetical protein DB30_03209 [Enhygromyxa salina]|uniref:Uncharacterized protein n=1 Tax=Enhygromyxa salina TaxID=215803 RepID=A0A0C2A277_9BACT|nr:hypothetical protein [Enhygromyxa salina]KIG17508.1 hypothetical protein DB30_03209 [Enhygromyxa salina]
MTARASSTLAPILALNLLCLSACDKDQAQDQAKDKAREVGEQALDKAHEVGVQAKDKAGELADDALDKGKQMWTERNGQLSDAATGILAKGAQVKGDGVEALLQKGQQLAPVAMDVAKTLHASVDSDVDIEPIIQKLDDEDAQRQLDQRIGDMPRVETINGVDVGFRDVSAWDSGGRESESAYLILWRANTHLIGLVYRSRQRIHIDKMVAEAPRLVGLAQGAL